MNVIIWKKVNNAWEAFSLWGLEYFQLIIIIQFSNSIKWTWICVPITFFFFAKPFYFLLNGVVRAHCDVKQSKQ